MRSNARPLLRSIASLALLSIGIASRAAAPSPPATPNVASHDRVVDPATWLLKAPGVGRIPVKQTIRQILPPDRTWQAINYVDQWPATAWLPDRWEIANINGGHQVGAVAGVVYTSLRTLTRRFGNQARTQKREADMPGDGTPDDEGVLKAMHGYNAYVARRARWGYGKELFVVATLYSGAPDPIAYYDPDVAFGGADTFYKGARNRHFAAAMGYGKAVESDWLKGFFIGEAWRYHPIPTFGFIRGDMSEPDYAWPDPLDYGNAAVLIVDDERRLVIGLNSGDGVAAPYFNLYGIDPARPDYRKPVRVPFKWPAELGGARIECDRAGFTALKGRGIVGIARVAGKGVGIQIRLAANPYDQPTVTVPFTDVPIPPNGAFGSHKAIAELGITAYDVSPDEQPVQIRWPAAND